SSDAEQLHTDGLAGLLFRRIDMKIGSMGEDVATMGVGDPEGEDGKLIAGADEILAEELSQIVEGLNRVDAGDIVFRFFGCSRRRSSDRNWSSGWGRLGDEH